MAVHPLKESELILNSDGSVYHLNLLPEDIAPIIITVGDPERVAQVSNFFDSIEVKKAKREFHCHTGAYQGKRLSVISTGIGTDNIDIVFNELDALVNIDLQTRTIKEEHTALTLIRIGTSGCMDKEIPVDGILLSTHGLGMEGLLNFYDYVPSEEELEFIDMLLDQTSVAGIGILPYLFAGSERLINHFSDDTTIKGITVTCSGFYGPQGRKLRLRPKLDTLLDELQQINVNGKKLTNFEMETAGIYGMANLLGHEALSVNVLIANRAAGKFSKNPSAAMQRAIEWLLEKVANL